MKKKTEPNHITIQVPDIQAQKLESIELIARALVNLTAALNKTETTVTVKDCTFTAGMQINTK